MQVITACHNITPLTSIARLDDGDATNHESSQGPDHQAYHGLALAVLRSIYNVAGEATLAASCAGLTPASFTVSTVAAK